MGLYSTSRGSATRATGRAIADSSAVAFTLGSPLAANPSSVRAESATSSMTGSKKYRECSSSRLRPRRPVSLLSERLSRVTYRLERSGICPPVSRLVTLRCSWFRYHIGKRTVGSVKGRNEISFSARTMKGNRTVALSWRSNLLADFRLGYRARRGIDITRHPVDGEEGAVQIFFDRWCRAGALSDSQTFANEPLVALLNPPQSFDRVRRNLLVNNLVTGRTQQ